MKRRHVTAIVTTVLWSLTTGLAVAQDHAGTAFTYQGQIKKASSPLDGSADFKFSLWNAESGGTQVGSTISVDAVSVEDGLFAVALDFGSGAWTGAARWLEIEVRSPSGSGNYTTLAPRQEVTPGPYALFADNAKKIRGNEVSTAAPATGEVLEWDGSAWAPADDDDTTYTAGTGLDLTGTTFSLDTTFTDNRYVNESQANSISTAMIQNDAVTTAKLPTGAVSTSRLADAAVTSEKLADNAVSSAKLANNAVTTGKLSDYAVTAAKLGNIAGYSLDVSYNGTLVTLINNYTGKTTLSCRANQNDGTAINAYADGSGKGIRGGTWTGIGIEGYCNNTGSSAGDAVYGYSKGGIGVHGQSDSGDGVHAEVSGGGNAVYAHMTGTGHAGNFQINNSGNNSEAVLGFTNGTGRAGRFTISNASNTATALQGNTTGKGDGVFGGTTGTGRAGVFVINNTSNSSNAVYASTNGSGWAGYFTGSILNSSKGVYVSTNGAQALQVVGGTKSAVVPTSLGARALYCEESAEVWFTDYGFGQLTDGAAWVEIDPLLAEAVNLEQPYHVFVQSYGEATLYVSERGPSGFVVRARAGDADVEFSYRLVARRRDFEDLRLEPAPWAEEDPNLYR